MEVLGVVKNPPQVKQQKSTTSLHTGNGLVLSHFAQRVVFILDEA
jgi:hypothetical protein